MYFKKELITPTSTFDVINVLLELPLICICNRIVFTACICSNNMMIHIYHEIIFALKLCIDRSIREFYSICV